MTSGQVDNASATETVDLDLIPGRVKPNTIKIGTRSFPAWRSALKETVWSFHRVWRTGGQVAVWLKDRQVPLQSLAKANIIGE